ncbi:MAG: two-component regulator propeller domain-containing protein, partial [Eudoraea sp.]|uniref:sensor histidine kinase n=1 Tax=Eudoraea sp. TaxID=1979955 RepID=UPI003C70D4D0
MKPLRTTYRPLKVLGLLLIYLIAVEAYPQEYGFNIEKIDGSSGFSGNGVLSMAQDERGIMWFGTINALFEYDGFQFKRHQQLKNKNSLIGRFVKGLAADQAGNLWITIFSDYGLQRLDLASGKFYQYSHEKTNPNSISSDNVTDVFIDGDKNLWVFGLESLGLNRVILSKSPEEKDFVSFCRYPIDKDLANGLSGGKIWSVADDRKGHLWIATTDGLNKLNIASGKITKYYHDDKNTNSLMSNVVNTIYIDSEGWLWIGSDKGLSYVKNPQAERLTFVHFKSDSNNPNPLFEDNDNIPISQALPSGKSRNNSVLPGPSVLDIIELEPSKIMIGTIATGVTLFDKRTHLFSNEINNLVAEKFNISEWTPERIFMDREGVVWIASGLSHGIIKLTRNRFKLLRKSFPTSDPIGKSHILGMTAWQEVIWVADEEGLQRFDLKNQSFKTYDFKDKGNLVLNTDRNGTLWIGSDEGVYYFDETKDQIIPYELPIYKLHEEARSTSNVLHDSQGNYWVSTWRCGISKVSSTSGRTEHYYLEGEGCAFDENRINVTISMHESKDGKIWAGTFKGIYVFNPKNDGFEKVATYRDCGAIIDGPGNSILFASEDNIQKLDLNDYSNIEDFVENKELTDQFHVNNFVLDDKGHLWVNTPQAGLWVYEPETNRVQNFSVKQGVQGNDSGFHCMVKNSNGEIITSGISDVNIFNPELVRGGETRPQVSILNIRTSSNDRNWDDINLNAYFSKDESIILPYQVHTITISYRIMDFHDSALNRYEYKLDNFQETWSKSKGNQNYATFTNLDKGNYTFKVRGANSYGVWNEEGAEIEIIILPALWETWWAYSLYFLLGLIFIYLIFKYRLKRVQLKSKLKSEQLEAKRLSELDELKSNFFANISHEFRTPLTLILAYCQKIAEDKTKVDIHSDLEVIRRNSNRVLHLVNQLLDLSKIESGNFELEFRPYLLNEIVQDISSQFVTLAEMKTISFQINTEHVIQGRVDLDKIELVLNNIISNAIKFTPPGGKVWIELKPAEGSMSPSKSMVEIIVGDTGPGISLDEQEKIFDRFYQVNASFTRIYGGTGIGLAISKEIVKLHGGEIKIISRLGEGSIFKIRLPIPTDNLAISNSVLRYQGKEKFYPMIDLDINKKINGDSVLNVREKPQVLIIEDNTDLQRFLSTSLSENYNIEIASN